MIDGDGPRTPRRIGPLGIAIALALIPAVGVAATVAVKQLRSAPRPVAALPTPTPTPSPMPTTPLRAVPSPLPSTVPSGVDVLYWANWDNAVGGPLPLDAVDLSGHRRGTIQLPATTDIARSAISPTVIPAPNGRALLVGGDVYAEDGSWLGTVPDRGQAVWADNSTGLCLLSQAGTGLHIELDGVNGSPFAGHEVPLTDEESGETPALLACAASQPQQALVLLAARQAGQATAVLLVDLYGGDVTVERRLCDGVCAQNVVASPDAKDVAFADSAGHVSVLSVASGAEQPLDLSGWPAGFSGDGTDLLVSLTPPRSTTMLQQVPGLRLVDWRSGAVRWSRSDAQTLQQWAFPLPDGIAVAACDFAPATGAFPSGPCSIDVVDGRTVARTAQGLDFAFSAGPF